MTHFFSRFGMAVLAIMAIFSTSLSLQAAESGEMKPLLIASLSSFDGVWDDVEQFADLAGYKDVVIATRSLVADVQGLEKGEAWGFVLMTDGDTLVPFGFIPVASLDELEFDGSDDLKEEIEITDEGKFIEINPYDNPYRLQLLEKDGFTYVFQEGKEEFLPEENPVELLGGLNNEYLFGFKAFLDSYPTELINNLFAPIRLILAEETPDQEATFNLQIEYLNNIVQQMETLTVGLKRDADNQDLVFEIRATAKAGSNLAEMNAKSADLQTSWNAFFQPENAVIAANTAVFLPQAQIDFSTEYYTMLFDQLINQLDLLALDEEDNKEEMKEQAKTLLENLKIILVDSLNAMKDNPCDFAYSLTTDPMLMCGGSIAQGQKIQECLQQIYDFTQSSTDEEAEEVAEFVKKYVKLNSGKFANYTVSTLIIPFDDILNADSDDEFQRLLADKELALLIAVKDDALILLTGLDKKLVSDSFKQLAKSTEPSSLPSPQVFLSFSNLAKLIQQWVENESPQVAAILDIWANGGSEACFTVDNTLEQNTIVVQERFNSQNFVLIGDTIRKLNESSADSDEDYEDDLFDESSAEDEDDWSAEDEVDSEDAPVLVPTDEE